MEKSWDAIKELFLYCINYFLPKELSSSDKREYQVAILSIFITFITTLFYAPYCYLLGMPVMAFACIITPPVCLLASYTIKFFDQKVVATNFVCLSIFITILMAYYAGGMGSSPPIVWFFVFPVVAVILVGARHGIFWTLTSLFGLTIAEIWRFSTGHAFSEFTPVVEFYTNMVNIIIGSIILFVFVAYALKSKSDAIALSEDVSRDRQKILSILFHDISNLLHVAFFKTSPMLYEKYTKNNTFDKEMAKVHKSLQMMSELIKYVKELESFKSGKRKMSIERVHVEEVLQDVEFVFKDKLLKKDLTLEIDVREDIYVEANKSAIFNNVLNNFVSNAIKFSPPNSTIRIKVEESKDFVDLSISDSGIGMPQTIIDNLFEFDKKTSRKGTNGEPGSGFGMPIAKSAIELFGGKLAVESKENVGTTFKVTLKKSH